MSGFLRLWHESALTSLRFFWMAFWAFALGYLISSGIQVFVTRRRMRRALGDDGPRSIALAAFFGFISSSCSFAALSTMRSLFAKGAGFVSSLAFLLASTNLVIELGIVIAVFLTWPYVVGEYVGGVLLIVLTAVLVRLTAPRALVEAARERAKASSEPEEETPDWKELIRSREGWVRVARRYFMEWSMVGKDVLLGFAVAGIIAVFVPASFFQALFVGTGAEGGPSAWQTVLHAFIGPLAAFFTFIGSMGNIPLAAVLAGSGVGFAGVMAFIFSDLVVFPVLRISGRYFGWRAAFYILGVFLLALVGSALALHAVFALLGILPDPSTATVPGREGFTGGSTLVLNGLFAAVTAGLGWLAWRGRDGDGDGHEHGGGRSRTERVVGTLAVFAALWIVGGMLAGLLPAV